MDECCNQNVVNNNCIFTIGLAGDLKLKQIRAHRLMVRTAGFHPVNVGSIPAGRTNFDVTHLFLIADNC